MRLVRQPPNTAICGPVAIYNLHKILNPILPLNWKLDHQLYKKLVGYIPHHGTKVSKMTEYLSSNYNSFPITNPSIEDIHKYIYYPQIMRYIHRDKPGKDYGHFCLLLGKQGNRFIIVNDAEKRETISLISTQTLRSYLNYRRSDWKNSSAIIWPIKLLSLTQPLQKSLLSNLISGRPKT